MLFNSYEYIFIFLPLVLTIFYLASWFCNNRIAIGWLVCSSIFFYSWWNYVFTFLLVSSIVFNYFLSMLIKHNRSRRTRTSALVLGITANLLCIGYFKYMDFFIVTINNLTSAELFVTDMVLPLAISFYTFQQISFLIDVYGGRTVTGTFTDYCLFVCFFPQLIAGPIVHHSEMMPQFRRDSYFRLNTDYLAVGATIFSVGLFKKAVLADGIAAYATPVFAAAESGATLDFFAAWGGALAYTFQLYFDFSGYSDMAIGAAWMFGIRLPLNFNSPYKACSIIDFWRRWHMTLSRFLRDYLYIPLGGSQHGVGRWTLSLMVTMLLGGLWHGAGWTFVAWGGLHGIYLVINHVWRQVVPPRLSPLRSYKVAAWLITFVAVVVAWVFFRAATFEGALAIVTGMIGLNGAQFPAAFEFKLGPLANILHLIGVEFTFIGGRHFLATCLWIAALFVIAVALPNTYEWVSWDAPRKHRPNERFASFGWRPSRTWAAFTATLLAAGVLALTEVSEFLYFQF